MAATARLLTSVQPDQRERFSELAAAQGLSSSRLLARLVHRALIENPEAKVKRLLEEAAAGKAPAEKYTVRLMGLDAARLESRAQARGVTASGYVAHVLRAHLRADPPMPYGEFQELKRVVNELGLRDYSVQRTVSRLQGGMVFNAGEWQAKLGDGQQLRGYYSALLVREADGVKIFEETVSVAAP